MYVCMYVYMMFVRSTSAPTIEAESKPAALSEPDQKESPSKLLSPGHHIHTYIHTVSKHRGDNSDVCMIMQR